MAMEWFEKAKRAAARAGEDADNAFMQGYDPYKAGTFGQLFNTAGGAGRAFGAGVMMPAAEGLGYASSSLPSYLQNPAIMGAAAIGTGGAALGELALDPLNLVAPEAGLAEKGIGAAMRSEVPEWVARKAQAIEAMHGPKALAKMTREYADAGVPLFSHDLPMDEVSRMARAKEMGFDEVPFYHGTNQTIPEFNLRKVSSGSGAPIKAVFGSENVTTAEDFAALAGYNRMMKIKKTARAKNQPSFATQEIADEGQNIMPLRENTSDMATYTGADNGTKRHLDLAKAQEAIENARSEGKGGVYFKGVKEATGEGMTSNNLAILNPKNIRSKFAAFDPRMKDSANLLAGFSGLGFSAILQQEAEKAKQARQLGSVGQQ